ncbi:MAG: class I SAM-dependent methyltransferase [Armatimonadetes bacterium]|nr:class I SAM-dependent methyltransferase [Armatimonadota bacterium]
MDSASQFGPVADSYRTSAVHADQDDLAHLVELVSPQGGVVVDIATGAGHLALAFAPLVDKVIATDITPEMLDLTLRSATGRGLTNVVTQHAWAEDLPFAENSLDGVCVRMAPHHFLDPRQFVSEVFRVLKPGGWFLFNDNIGIDDDPLADEELQEFERMRDPSHVRTYTSAVWRGWFEQTGFEISHEERTWNRMEIEGWMDRMRVQEPARSRLRLTVTEAEGILRDYLVPEGENDSLSFVLHKVTLVARA